MSDQLLKSTTTVSGMTFISRILGFARDMIIAQVFGASAGLDAFLVAFKIPNFMRRLFAEGAFSQAFVPVLSEYVATKSRAEVKALLDKVSGSLFSVLFVITLMGCMGASGLIFIFAPGFKEDAVQFNQAVDMLRWTFPYLLFISLTAFLSGVQNTHNKFALPAFTPVLLNVSLIFAAIFLTGWASQPVYALAWGVLIGGILQLGFQLPSVHKLDLMPKPKIAFSDPGVRRILKLMVPALIGASAMQINLLVDTIFASYLPKGSLTWLYYSDRLLEFPIGMFGVAIATVVLPHLSKQYANKQEKSFSASLDWALKLMLCIGLPCTIGLILLAQPILSTLFQYGKFSGQDVILASHSLMALSTGLVAFLTVKVFISAFYARQNTVFPLKVALMAIVFNIIFNSLLIGPLQHAGLALASTLAQFCQLTVLLYFLLKKNIYEPQMLWRPYLLRLVLANVVMGYFLHLFLPQDALWLEAAAVWRASHLALFVVGAMIIYALVLWIVGIRVRHFKLQPLSESL